jgi:hypothetical protein
MPNKKVVFAGHGALNAKSDKEFFTVPAGVTLYFWVRHGSAFVGSELDGHDPRELLGGGSSCAAGPPAPWKAPWRGCPSQTLDPIQA